MSHKDTSLRTLIAMLQTLGYPQTISLGSFYTPNFPLVASILVWLTKRFELDADIPLKYDTVEDRVKLIRHVAEFMAVTANLKLNTKKLYQADSSAVSELSKITRIVYDVIKLNVRKAGEDREETEIRLGDYNITDKRKSQRSRSKRLLSVQVSDLKQSKTLATEITASGASLFDLLGKEVEMKPLRNKSMNRRFEVNDVEDSIKKAIDAIKKEIEETNQLIDNVSVIEVNLDAKIERRKAEIDRYERRLETLNKVRPAFLEEFNALEQEMEKIFLQYSTKLRCLNYLESLVGDEERAEAQRQQLIAAKKNVERISLNSGELEHSEMLSLGGISPEQKHISLSRPERPRASTGERQKVERPSRALEKHEEGSESSLDLSTDSDSDDVFLDKDEPELIQSDDDSLDFEMGMGNLERAPTTGRRTVAKMQDTEDF